MNVAAQAVMTDLHDIVVAYGISDEYRYFTELKPIGIEKGKADDVKSFVFHKSCALFERRARYNSHFPPRKSSTYLDGSKLVSTVVSTFTAHYVYHWYEFFPDQPLTLPLPSFDGRAVVYPTVQNLRDYMSWRQVDCKLILCRDLHVVIYEI
jgi:tRNA(His) guanylyltransferase